MVNEIKKIFKLNIYHSDTYSTNKIKLKKHFILKFMQAFVLQTIVKSGEPSLTKKVSSYVIKT